MKMTILGLLPAAGRYSYGQKASGLGAHRRAYGYFRSSAPHPTPLPS